MNFSEADPHSSLFPAWKARGIPDWMVRAGLGKVPLATSRYYMHDNAIRQAESDGIGQVVPMIMALGGDPAYCRRKVGREAWKLVHHASLVENTYRAKAMFMFGVKFRDALVIRGPEARSSHRMIEDYGLGATLWAFRKATDRHDCRAVGEAARLYRDLKRMTGRVPDPNWSVGRLRREHDAATFEYLKQKSDPTPWADPWSFTVDGYTFALLRSERDFFLEGREMRHCVASYVSAARNGRTVVFSVRGEERATAEFPRTQIKSHANRPVSHRCRLACLRAYKQYEHEHGAA